MEERQAQNVLTQVLFSALNAERAFVPEFINKDTLAPLYCVAKKHDVAQVLSSFVHSNKIEVPSELSEKLQMEEFVAVYRNEQLKYAFDEICAAFNEAEIAFVPLKGVVIRPYYPDENMRTSCDIDILVREDELDSAVECLKGKGFTCGEKGFHDVSLYSPNKVHLELHFNLCENIPTLDKVLKNAWEYAERVEKSRYAFRDEFFVFHIFSHMAYHFSAGGCGIRSLMDIWIMEHKMGLHFSSAAPLLSEAGLYTFADKMRDIAEKCFSENAKDEFSERVLSYIFSGGVYGSEENQIAVNKTKSESTLMYALKRLFLPYRAMAVSYPVLVKAPYLLPFCWVARWIRVIFDGKSRRVLSELAYANNMSDDSISEMKEICSQLGL